MAETFVAEDLATRRAGELRFAAGSYDTTHYPGLEHLRPHQVETPVTVLPEPVGISMQAPYGDASSSSDIPAM